MVLNAIRSALRDTPDPATADVRRVEARLYRLMPGDPDRFLDVANELMAAGDWPPFWLVTMWIKRHGGLYDLRHFDLYERWLYDHVDGWGKCDVFCYRVLNPMVEEFPDLFGSLVAWTGSDRTYVRRAAPVALIESHRSFSVNVEFEKVSTICDLLVEDREMHVQKGIGWLLKYAYLTHPDETVRYLTDNVGRLSRTAFRYGLEKMPLDVRSRLMTLGR